MVRNNPLTLRDPDGLTPKSPFEEKILPADYQLTFRGIDSIEDNDRVSALGVRKSIEIAAELTYKTSVHARTESGVATLLDWLSAERADPAEVNVIVSAFSSALEMLSTNILAYANQNQDKVVGFSAPKSDNTVGMTLHNDPNKRMYINRRFVHGNAFHLIPSVIHELSHAYMETKDFWYLPTYSSSPERYRYTTDNGILSKFSEEQYNSQREMFDTYSGIIPSDWVGDDTIPAISPMQWNYHDSTRVGVTLSNADSITALILHFSRDEFIQQVSNLHREQLRQRDEF
jgi:hypothetical protein